MDEEASDQNIATDQRLNALMSKPRFGHKERIQDESAMRTTRMEEAECYVELAHGGGRTCIGRRGVDWNDAPMRDSQTGDDIGVDDRGGCASVNKAADRYRRRGGLTGGD
ncbi:MAG: hypothetical protein LV480_10425 [Methylacidiphilales bacterium]|nr:hypothetical protein [Candidatus Methylacidiphilales bacterium]